MRRRLVSFYYNPNAKTLTFDGHGRTISKFQQDVGEALSRAGFRLISEYEVAGRFIDWVVEDRDRRLAIECDGDTWHGPDRYEADMLRQRMLERCGWEFLRIRGSVFYANQSKAIEGLIHDIRAHGLEPYTITEDEAVPRDWIQEISGNECMEALGAYTVDTAEENIVQQRGLFPEESDGATADTATAAAPQASAASSQSRAQQPPQRSASPSTAGEASPSKRPISSPGSAGSTSRPPTTVSKPTATFVTGQEREAVRRALDEAGKPLVMWKLAETSKLAQRRIEEILPILVGEGLVKRVEAADAVRYSRA
jgi:very-short-patch-repair endonuclease